MFAATLIAAIAIGPLAAVPRGAALELAGPAERFAADVVARADAGYVLRDLGTARDGDRALVQLVLADDRSAFLYQMSYAADSGRPLGYRSEPITPPAVPRHYPVEGELLDLLRAGAPDHLLVEHGRYAFDRGTRRLTLEPERFYVVESRHTGGTADAALAHALARAIDDGLDLIDVRQANDELGQAVVLELSDGGDERIILHAGTDRHGRVAVLEIRRAVLDYVDQRYGMAEALREQLRLGKAIHSLRLVTTPAGDAIFIGGMRGNRTLRIDPADFVPEEDDCGC